MQLLEVIDITRISSVNVVANIFESLGRLSFDSFAEKFLWTLKYNGMLIVLLFFHLMGRLLILILLSNC